MGALKSALFVGDANGYDAVQASLLTATGSFGGTLAGVSADIQAGANAQRAVRNTPSGSDVVASFTAAMTAGDKAHIAAYVSGAVQAAKGKAAEFVKSAYQNAGALSLADRQAVVAAAVTGNFGAVSKIVTTAITTGPNGISAVDAVTAAIPAASDLYSGLATLAAMKTISVASPAADSQAVLQAAITAAVGASYQGALPDIALSPRKRRNWSITN